MKTICILGAGGQLGLALQRLNWQSWLGELVEPRRLLLDLPYFDLTRDDHLRQLVDRDKPDIVINAAAYTNVEGAETDVNRCRALNVEAPGQLARLCAERNILLVQASTDYVFDGLRATPYTEDCPTAGLSVYGKSKADGERAVMQAGGPHLVVRSSWLFGEGNNFVQTVIRLAGDHEAIPVVCDQTGCPTSALDFAHAIARLLRAGCTGLYHFSNAGPCSWYDFACEIVRLAGLTLRIDAAPTVSLTRFKAARPAYSVMDCRKYRDATGHQPRGWSEALEQYLCESGHIKVTKAG